MPWLATANHPLALPLCLPCSWPGPYPYTCHSPAKHHAFPAPVDMLRAVTDLVMMLVADTVDRGREG